jgi:hypothetical protein
MATTIRARIYARGEVSFAKFLFLSSWFAKLLEPNFSCFAKIILMSSWFVKLLELLNNCHHTQRSPILLFFHALNPSFFLFFFLKKKLFFQLFPPVHIPYNVTQKQKKATTAPKRSTRALTKNKKEQQEK